MDTNEKAILFICHANQDFESLKTYVKLLSRSYAGQSDVIVIMPDSPRGYEAVFQKNKDSIQESLEADFETLGLKDKTSVSFMGEKNAALDIVRKALQNNYEMIVKIKDGIKSGKQKGFRAIDMNLLRKCPCPVWVVDQKAISDTPRIVTAIDPFAEEKAGLDLNFKLIKCSEKLNEILNGCHIVMSCWDFAYEKTLRESALVKTDSDEVDQILKSTEAEHLAAVESIVKKSGAKPHEIIVKRGKAQQAIPSYLEDNEIDILVMGTVARTGIPGFIIGNTAENILQQISCDLMAVKPDGFVCPVKKN